MKHPFFILSPLLLPIFIASHALASNPSHNATPLNWYLGLSTGIGISEVGETTNVHLTPAVTNQYQANHDIIFVPFFGANLGYEWLSSKSVMLAMGLGGYYFNFNTNTHRGTVHPFYNLSDDFDRLNFQYSASSTVLWGESRFSFGQRLWQPYLFLGMGLSANYLSNYIEQAQDESSSTAPMIGNFRENNRLAFSYGIGFGATRSVAHGHAKFGLEYRYFNFGEGIFKSTSIQTTSNGLSSGTLYAHTLLLSLYI